MKSFIKFTIAAFIGAGLAFIAVFFICLLFGIALVGSASDQQKKDIVKDESVLKITADQFFPEKTNNVQQSNFSFKTDDVVGYYDLLKAIRKAKESRKIKGIYLELMNVPLGHTQLHELTDEIESFREAGKFVYAYSDIYTQHAYALATAADSIFLHPMGKIEIKGYATTRPYYKDLREKLGIEIDIYNTGDFKSHGENYLRSEMSESNRLQTLEYLTKMKETLMTQIAENRNLSYQAVDDYADDYMTTTAQEAIDKGFADVSAYEADLITHMKKKLGIEDSKSLPMVDIASFISSTTLTEGKGENKIALVFAEGTILDDTEDRGVISDERYVPLIDKLSHKEEIKGMVLRVNSGGGSVIASDNIYAALLRFQAAGKKIVVSMGDVAASGGYYISMNADHIYAEESTITGSIGVVSMIPNASKMLEEKVGINFETVSTDPLAGGFGLVNEWSQKERDIFQRMTDEYYSFFLQKVSDGRDIPVEDLKKIAGGRVWTGAKALELGLIDELGGLTDAIAKLVELTELEEYRITEYPKFQSPLLEMLAELQGKPLSAEISIESVASQFPELKRTMQLLEGGIHQAVMLDQIK